MVVSIFNTMSRVVEPVRSVEPYRIKLFVCGPTVYDLCHVGHAKTYTQFDFVARYLGHVGYDVDYLQNITDVDDKIIERAVARGIRPRDLAAHFEEAYLTDMATLGNRSVNTYARAHDYIPQIVEQVRLLAEKGHAYRLDDGWYFDLSTFSDYGKLSGRTSVHAEDSVSRIDDRADKRNPGDFALWKAYQEGDPYWDTALGKGRPGWHIEDTAITQSHFGAQYDIHGGAIDLIFPHHEAEIAQMEAASGLKPLARHWMHGGLLRVDGAKMAKSARNFTTIRDALDRVDARELRYLFLSQHYRASMEFSESAVENARRALRRIDRFARIVEVGVQDEDGGVAVAAMRVTFFERLNDDFDSPGALAVLFAFIRDRNRDGVRLGAQTMAFLHEFNGLFSVLNLDKASLHAGVSRELDRRAQFRAAGRYAEADAIRSDLARQGIGIEDTASGTRWFLST
ncbi:cysteine--tRNA ligase [Micromonospora chokoriensis]